MENRKTCGLVFTLVLVLGFYSAAASPTLEFRNLSVYNVSSAADEDQGGELLKRGSNTTYLVNQSQFSQKYRFSFRLENTGTSNWTINSSDQLFHKDLNSSWSIDKIWYNTSRSQYQSGTFSNGKLEWNTSKGGNVTDGENFYAKYLVTIETYSSERRKLDFYAEDDESGAKTEDNHTFDLTKLGFLNLTLNDPVNDTVVTQNQTFLVNSTIECLEGECGTVDASTRYNQSRSADTLIPENSGEPFHTISANTKQCSSDLKKDTSCEVIWDVNATGEIESYHLVDVNASSSRSKVEENDSEDHLVQINKAIILNMNWTETNFGLLDPGQKNKPAIGNDNLTYNLTVAEASDPVDNLWVRATDLQSKLLPQNYSIGAGNVSYSFQNDISTEENLTNTYQKAKSSISPGTNVTSFYWIDVPYGIYRGEYTGNIYFKANSTG